jgi:hypothetical protein
MLIAIERLVLEHKAPAVAAAKLHSIPQKGDTFITKSEKPAKFWMSEKLNARTHVGKNVRC